jgi:hypothetical protein
MPWSARTASMQLISLKSLRDECRARASRVPLRQRSAGRPSDPRPGRHSGLRRLSVCLAAALPLILLTANAGASDAVGAAPSATSRRGTAYYISARTGSDRNSGRSPQRPWRTLRRLRSVTLRANDSLSFAAGETWNTPLVISAQGGAGAPVVIGSYGKGAPPAFEGAGTTCVELHGAYLVFRRLRVSGCRFGIRIYANDARVTNATISNNAEGLRTEPGSSRAVVSGDVFMNNNQMIVNTPCSQDCSDDYGAVGVLVAGNGGRFSHNRISGSYAQSFDVGHDGSAFEVYGGSNNRFDHNLSRQNEAFIEIGCACSRAPSNNNEIDYNVVTSTLSFGVNGVVAHGSESFGPTYSTKVYNNSIYITSPNSEALHCGSCNAAMMKLRNNAVLMTGDRSGYNYSGADEDYDLISGKPIWGGRLGPHSRAANPRFTSLTNLRLRNGSPAIKHGLNLGPAQDFTGSAVNGIRDIGAYKFKRSPS